MRRSAGTLQTLRAPLPWPPDRSFRILSIDGGGILGILPATILSEFERKHLKGESVGKYFDLITGTSTGGIIALALSIDIPASQILELYLKYGAEVFPPSRFGMVSKAISFVWNLGHYRYQRQPLEMRLQRIFGSATIGDAVHRLCVPTFDGFTEVNVFKTPHHPDFKRDWRESMVTVALATAAAPTFFPVYRDSGRHFGDGGVWAGNPVMIGLVDALSCYSLPRRNVSILSIGCGDREMRMTRGQIRFGGIWQWLNIIDSAMHLQSQNALGQTGLLIGRDHLTRINAPPSAGEEIAMDDYESAVDQLPTIGVRLADEFADVVKHRFFLSATDIFPAYYGPRAIS